MQTPPREPEPDTPLPATLRFVMTMGIAFVIGWFLFYALLLSRW